MFGFRGRLAASVHPGSVRSAAVHVLAIGVATGCWVLAVLGAAPASVSGWGLLGVLPYTYLLGLAILAVGFAAAASSERVRPAVLAAYVIALVVMLTATTALLYPEPRYAWVYKHLGVIDYIRLHGSSDRSLGIYNNWPAFFALNAWFSHALGISPLRYANWAQCFFDLANISGVLFVVRGVTRNTRTQWTAAWLFEVANWVGQDYLSPQAFAFFLSLVAIGLLLRCSPMRRPPRSRADRALEALMGRLASRLLRGRTPRRRDAAPPPMGARGGLLVAGVCYLAVVLTHQLSPIFVILAAVLLSVTARRPVLWVIVAMVTVEAWWVWLAYPFLSKHFELFSFDPSTSARPILTAPEHPLTGVTLTADISRATIVLIALAAVPGVLRRLRDGEWDPAAIALAGAPALIILIQSYGGEGPLRIYLFALPWLAFLGATAVAPRPRAPLLRATRRASQSAVSPAWRLLALTAVVGACSLTGIFGQESTNYYTADDVAATQWWFDHASSDASLTYVTPNYPGPVDAYYATHLQAAKYLTQTRGFPHTLSEIERVMARDLAPQRYLVFSPSQERSLRLYGVLSPTAYKVLLYDVATSTAFKLVYRHGEAFVFQFTGVLHATPRAVAGQRVDGCVCPAQVGSR